MILILTMSMQTCLRGLEAALIGTALILFNWQDNLVGVARFIDACLELVYICI